MLRCFRFLSVFLILFCFSCSKSSGPASTPLPPEDFPETSINSMKSGDLTQIEETHCSLLTGDSEDWDATAGFGCFLVRLSQMFESAPITDFLAAISEPALHIQRDILDKNNASALCPKMAAMHPKKYYQQFSNIPFSASYDFKKSPLPSKNHWHRFFREMRRRVKVNGIALSRFQNDLSELDTRLEELLKLLSVPKGDSDFTFVIPKETCGVMSKDIVIKKIDIDGAYGALGSLKIFANILGAYTIGLDPARFISTTGEVNRSEFVKDANGVGGDGKKIVELKTGSGDKSGLKPLMQEVVASVINLLDNVHTSADSDVFGHLVTNSTTEIQKTFGDIHNVSKDMQASLNDPATLTPMTHFRHTNIRLNMTRFLQGLPDPKAVNNADPFVLRGSRRIETVPSFWRTLLTNIASF